MIIYEKPALPFVSLKWRALITLPNISLAILFVAGFIMVYADEWGYLFTIVIYGLFIGIGQLYSLQKARALIIETREYDLRIVYRKYFSVKEVIISNEDVKVELYNNGFGTYFGSPHYLYFYSRSNHKIDIELHRYYDTIGKVLTQLSKEKKIELHAKELSFVDDYLRDKRWSKSRMGKIVNGLIATFFIVVIILIFYYLM